MLEWPLTRTKFEMRLKDIQTNVTIDDDQWIVPKMDNYPPLDLGEQVALQMGLKHQSVSEAALEPPPFDEMEPESLDSVRQRLHRSALAVETPPWDTSDTDSPFE